MSDRFETPKARRAALLDEAFAHVLSTHGTRKYTYWRDLIGKDPLVFPHPGDSKVEIEVSAIWDSHPEGVIRVLVSILHSTRFGISLPTKSFLIHSDDRVDTPSQPSSA